MPIYSYPSGPLDANAYLLHNGHDAVVADPPEDPDLILNEVKARKLTLRAILLTHMHFDHIGGCAGMIRATGLPVLVGKEDWELRDAFFGSGAAFGFPPIPRFEARVQEAGPIVWGSLRTQVIPTPGHSPGSLCYYFPDQKALLSGDLLFYHSVGRSDLPGGDSAALCQSLRQSIYILPDDTVVYPGHGDPTSVGDEAARNPFCRR